MACQGKTRSLCKQANCDICSNASLKYILQVKKIENLYVESNPPSHHLLPYSRTVINMKCVKCPHIYPTIPSNITSGNGCPYCNKGKLCENVINCLHCLPRCLISSEKAKYYVKENQPCIKTVTIQCNTPLKFTCPTCYHEITMSPDNIFKGRWCNYCTGMELCSINSVCDFCFKKSFASHPHSLHLSNPKEIENPRQYTLHSGQYTDFTCSECNHSFNMRIADVANGQWCPYCSWPTKKLCNQLPQCFHCYKRSIASHPLISHVDHENNINKKIPEFICMFSNTDLIWLKCSKKHSFSITPAHLCGGRWCPKCYLKTEAKMYSWLCEILSDVIRQFKPAWCKNLDSGAQLSFDFCIESKKVIIEVDGNQHFVDVPGWKSLSNNVRQRDKLKMEYAINNGYHIIRILQEDIWNDKYEWKSELLTLLSNLPETPTRIFICKQDEYNIYKS